MSDVREFHLGAVLSVTTGRLVAPAGIDDIYELLSFMTGDNLFTHQLPRAMDEVAPVILAQHPELASLDVPTEFTGKEHVEAWLAEQVARLGAGVPLSPAPAGVHTVQDPIAELIGMMRPDQGLIVVQETP